MCIFSYIGNTKSWQNNPKCGCLEGEGRHQIEEEGWKQDFSEYTWFYNSDFGCMEMFYFCLRINKSTVDKHQQKRTMRHSVCSDVTQYGEHRTTGATEKAKLESKQGLRPKVRWMMLMEVEKKEERRTNCSCQKTQRDIKPLKRQPAGNRIAIV